MKAQATTLYPFVPSGPNFKAAIAFFADLGFDKLWENGGYAGLRFGGAYFILQEIDVPDWQKNQMLVYEVDDLGRPYATADRFCLGPGGPHRRSGRCLLARAAEQGLGRGISSGR